MLTRLSLEVISYIIILAQEMAVAEENTSSNSGPVLPQPFEIVISHVNSTLRFVALHTSRLWSSIHLGELQDQRIMLERTNAYIYRSGGYLLDVRIELLDCQEERPSSGRYDRCCELRQTLALIAAQSGRWRRLSIVAENEGIVVAGSNILACLSKAQSLAPELEYLSISVDHNDRGDGGGGGPNGSGVSVGEFGAQHPQQPSSLTLPKIDLKNSRRLSFIRLRGLALYNFRLNRQPPLRVLHLDQTKALPLTYTGFHSIITSCPLLEHLSMFGDITLDSHVGVGGGGGPGTAAHFWRVLSLPELRSLRICGTDALVYRILLSGIEAPMLDNLVLKDVQEHDLDTLWEDPFTSSSIPSSNGSGSSGGGGRLLGAAAKLPSRFTQVRSLTISNSDLSLFVYQQLFKAFPAVTEFSSYSSMEVDLTPKLFMDGDDGDGGDDDSSSSDGEGDVAVVDENSTMSAPWPNLHMMTFVFNEDLEADDVMITEMLRRRRKSGCPLYKLRLGVVEVDERATKDWTDRREHGLSRNGTVVVVDKLDEYDIWPTDRLYADVDDVLF